jgi:hypothetical protein
MPTDEAAPRWWKRPLRRVPPLRRLLAERDALRQELAQAQARGRRLQRKRLSLQRVLAEKDAQLGRLQERRRADTGSADLGFLFVVTYGRSGSTLLGGILSSTPGFLIRGENGGALYHLYRFHRTCIREQQARRGTLARRHPQFGIEGYPGGIALADIRALALDTLIRPEPDSRVVGFKEIRWRYPDLDEYVEFLVNVFPGARFVVNTRDLDDVARSKWWAEKPDARAELEATDTRLRTLAERLGDVAFHVHYNDYVADPGRLRGLFEWLGEEFDEQRVREAMAVSYSY